MTLQSIDPASGKKMRAYDELSSDDIPGCIDKTHAAHIQWRRTGIRQHATMMEKLAGVLRSNAGEYSRLMALEMGKPVRDGNREIEKCAWLCRHYAAKAESMLESVARSNGCDAKFRHISALGCHSGRDALELPFLAGFSIGGTGLDGRQWRAAETRRQCAGLR